MHGSMQLFLNHNSCDEAIKLDCAKSSLATVQLLSLSHTHLYNANNTLIALDIKVYLFHLYLTTGYISVCACKTIHHTYGQW